MRSPRVCPRAASRARLQSFEPLVGLAVPFGFATPLPLDRLPQFFTLSFHELCKSEIGVLIDRVQELAPSRHDSGAGAAPAHRLKSSDKVLQDPSTIGSLLQ